MNRKLLLLIILVIGISCKKDSISKSVTLSVIGNNTKLDSIYLQTHPRLYLTSQTKVKHTIPINNENKFSANLTIPKGYYQLQAGDRTILLYLEAGFNLSINLQNPEVKINGTGALENMYLENRKKLEARLAPINFYGYYSNLIESDFLKLADSIQTLSDNLIKNYDLPNEDFKFLEESFVKIDRAHKLFTYPVARKYIDTNYIHSKRYPNYFEGININDERLVEIPLFNMLLFSSAYHHTDSILGDIDLSALRYATSNNSPITNAVVKEQLAFTILNFSLANADNQDLFYKTYIDFATSKYNISEISSKYYQLREYTKGTILPNFEFYNSYDNLVSLKSLRGKVVFFDIWATWCKPCIEEIGPSNALQERLSQHNIAFVSINIDSKKDKWLNVIDAYNFNGTHLFVPAENKNTFKQNYLIESLPRYIIMDQKGSVYDFNAKKPSDKTLEIELLGLLKRN